MGKFDPDVIPFHRKLVATLFLWVTRLKITDESRSYGKSPDTLHQFLDTFDQIHLSDPQLAVIYSDVLLDCINVNGDRATERPTSRAASICMLRTLSLVDWEEMVNDGAFDHYENATPPSADFEGRLCHHTMGVIHTLLLGKQERWLDWMDYQPLLEKVSIQVANQMRSRVPSKVPRWVLRFVLHFLSQDPPPPTSATIPCLSIIAIDLGCDISSTDGPYSEGYVGTLTCVYFSDLETVPR